MKNAYRIRSFPEGEPALESPDRPTDHDLAAVDGRIPAGVTPRVSVGDASANSPVATTEGGRVAHAEHRRRHVRGSTQIADRFFLILAGRKREMFLAIALDARNRVTHEFRIAEGTPTSCPVHPREVFRPLVRVGASRAIFVHNHPSGDPEPSQKDIEITTLLAFSGETLGIRVLDHVIVGDWDHYSFADSDLLGRGWRP